MIGISVGEIESEVEWRSSLRELLARGLTGVQLTISDAHQGFRNAIAQVLGAQWQRRCEPGGAVGVDREPFGGASAASCSPVACRYAVAMLIRAPLRASVTRGPPTLPTA